ncbi:MAG: DUF4239 domain-containing protein [Acidobacteriota bacterium]
MRIVAKMFLVIVIVTLLYPFIGPLSQRLAPEAQALGDYLQVYGAIYGVLAAFIIFVVWGQFTATETAIAKEVSNLEALAEMINFLDTRLEQEKAVCRRLISHYATIVADDEFKSLAKAQESHQAEATFSTLLKEIQELRARISSTQDQEIYLRILDIVSEAVRLRDDRVVISKIRMPTTLWHLLQGVSYTLVASSALLPIQNQFLGYSLLLMITLVCSLLLAVITDLDNPFQGVWNISSEPLRVLAAKYRH